MNMSIQDTFDELEAMTEGRYPASDSVGDPLDENPTQAVTRIYVQNLNGLSWNQEGGRWPYICEALATVQADIACFSELNTDTNRYDVRTTMEKICQQYFEQNRLVLASSNAKTTTAYKPGGTAAVACGAITTRIKSHNRDRMGRWASLCIQLSPVKKLRVISAYQVCRQSRPGTNTASSQQVAQLILEHSHGLDCTRQNPRQAFINDLSNFINQIQTDNEEIVLAGDFNDDIASPQSGMHQLATTCGLVDLFGLRLGTTGSPTTYQRGNKRLDYILISPSLIPAVQAAGYDPFGYRIPSDHRAMYLDLSTDMLFSQEPPTLTTAKKREFNTSTPGVITTYVTAKTKYLNDHRFFERLSALSSLQHPNNDLAESLDRDWQRASHHAARMCSKKPKPPWSPQLAQAWAELHYYRLLASAANNNVNYLPAIQRLQQKYPHLPQAVTTNAEAIRQGKKSALDHLKQARQRAQDHREEFLLQKHASAIATDDTTTAKILERIIRAESQRNVYRKLQYLRRQDNIPSGAISSIKIPKHLSPFDSDALKNLPDDNDHWETVTVPEQIEQLLMRRNRLHFAQADGSPFTRPPLVADVGYKADGYAADLILSGQIDFQNLTTGTELLVKHLQNRTSTTLDGQLKLEEVLQKLRRWKESTTTSPSGMHLGHYHCQWRDPKISQDDPARETIIAAQKKLMEANVTLMNYALRFGYTYERWSKVINVMLEKDAGNPRIHRLRIIHIYEADYNLLLAVKWRQALFHAEENQLLNSGLYGSRPGKSAQEPALLEVLQHETYRMSMKTGLNLDLDATSCYDRIVPSVAVLSSRRMGLSPKVTRVNALTLQNAQYYLKTQLGISESYYTHSSGQPIYGTGQGSGNSPTVWCFLCSALFDAFESVAHGAYFADYYKRINLPLGLVGFVDDCTQRVNQFDQNDVPLESLMIRMEQDAQTWHDLLWASGGALEPTKCSFHLIQSAWTANGQPFLVGGTISRPVAITHGDTKRFTRQKSNYDAHKTLGCFINPAFTRHQPMQAVSRKNEAFAQILDTNYLTRAEAWTYYTSHYLPSITYPLSITPLDKTQCQLIDARFLRSLLPCCGYNRNTPRAVRYAPFRMGGAGFRNIYVEQGTLILSQIHKFLNTPKSPIGQMLYITMSWTQAFLGTSKFFLQHPHQSIPPVGSSLLLDLRQFLQEIDGFLDMTDPPIPPLLRQNDRFIMDIALAQRCWKPRHVMHINACRRFLQAQTLADITNAKGTRLLSFALHGLGPVTSNQMRVSLFNQPHPGGKPWSTWRRFLSTISDRFGVLRQPLQNWTQAAYQTRRWAPYVYDPITDTLQSHQGGSTYAIHSRLRPGCFSIRPTSNTSHVTGFPTAVQMVMDTLRPDCNYTVSAERRYHSINIGIQDAINVDDWEQSLLGRCQALQPQGTICRSISHGHLISCSDGSVRQSQGSFGFLIATTQGTRLLEGYGPAPGFPATSFRSEAYGVLAAVRWLYHAFQAHYVGPTITITHYLDNQSVIHRIQNCLKTTWLSPNHRLLPEQDVIDEIVFTMRHMPIKIQLEWIQGHQDSMMPFTSLSIPAQLNCEADRAASKWHRTLGPAHTTIPPLPHTPNRTIIQGETITGYLKRRAYDSATIPALYEYLQHKFQWSLPVLHSIDWEIYQQIIKAYRTKWTTVVKHLHGISPTGKYAHRNNHLLPHECPACSTPFETNNHVITCPHPSRMKWRDETVQKITTYHTGRVDPYLVDILRDGISRLHRNMELLDPDQYPPPYQVLIEEQNKIGWDHLYRARWSQQWRIKQDDYAERHHPATLLPGSDWVRGLGRILLNQWLCLWTQRNEDRHGKDQLRHSALREGIIHAELKELYTYKLLTCPNDRHIFYPTADDHLNSQSSLDRLEDWIRLYRPAIMASVDQARKLGITLNHSIQRLPTNNPTVQPGGRASLAAGSPSE